MAKNDIAGLALLPLIGLCACTVAQADRAPAAPGLGSRPAIDPWREVDGGRPTPTLAQAAIDGGLAALAMGDYAAAEQALTVAADYEPGLAALSLARVDALIGLGELEQAQGVLDEIDDESLANERAQRAVVIREHSRGGDGPCDLGIASERQPLPRHGDFFSAWNQLRAGLPVALEIPIPESEDEARELLCGDDDCPIDEPTEVRLGDEEEQVVGLIVADADGGVTLIPELLHVVGHGCGEASLVATSRQGGLLHIRAIGDDSQSFEPSDWALARATAGRIVGAMGKAPVDGNDVRDVGDPNSGYAGPGSSYTYASAYYGAGSNYNGYAYGYNYGYGYDCGGYGYDYDACDAQRLVQRDLFVDLARGEVILDIRRIGGEDGAMGQVEARGGAVRVEACGLDETLALSWT